MKLKIKAFTITFITLFLYSSRIYSVNNSESKNLEISAPSAILMDQRSGKVLYEKNSSEVKYAASLMKIMNLIVCFSEMEEGNLTLKDEIRITDKTEAVAGPGVWLKADETISVEDLIKSISLVSANDACNALGIHISGEEGKFIAKMNDLATKLKLSNTIFKNCIGDDQDGNVSTAHDIACMAKKLLEYENAIPYLTPWIDHIRNDQTQLVNTNRLLKIYQGTTGVKTGTSKEAGSCICASAERNGVNLIAVVLGCQNPEERNRETISLLDYGFSEFSLISPKLPDNFPKNLKVKNGINPNVEISALIDESFLISKKNSSKIHSEVILNDNLEAPIPAGKKVGEIIYRQGEEMLCMCDVVAKTAVSKIKFIPMLQKLTLNLFKL